MGRPREYDEGDPVAFSPSRAARSLQVSRRVIRQAIANGSLKVCLLDNGRLRRITRKELVRWCEAHPQLRPRPA